MKLNSKEAILNEIKKGIKDGLTQKEIAKKLGKSEALISKIKKENSDFF